MASYFAPNGHYSGNLDYFATQGVDTPPLHALANGVSGGNGVYAYGATSTFPTNTLPGAELLGGRGVQPAPPPTLTSIAVTPANRPSTTGGTQQFTATGTYSDASTLTDEPGDLRVLDHRRGDGERGRPGDRGSTGTTTISATLGSVSGSTGLTVAAGPLTITTHRFPRERRGRVLGDAGGHRRDAAVRVVDRHRVAPAGLTLEHDRA